MSYQTGLKTQGFSQGIYEQSLTQKEALDTVRILHDGRMFAYARAGAVALGAALLTQQPIASATANDETVYATAAIGATEIQVTFGGAVTADFYKDGYLWVNDDTGEGHAYRVKGHAAGTTGVVVYLKDQIRVAVTAGAGTVSLIANRQNLVIVQATTITGAAAGIPPIPVDINYYFWNQVKGWAPCLNHTGSGGAATIGEVLVPATTNTPVAGAVEVATAADCTIQPVGTCLSVNATTEYGLMNLAIPGY